MDPLPARLRATTRMSTSDPPPSSKIPSEVESALSLHAFTLSIR